MRNASSAPRTLSSPFSFSFFRLPVIAQMEAALPIPLVMKKRALGQTDLQVSEIGFGCASYWGKAQFDEALAIGLVRQACDRGVTLFDTGHSYSDGNAELRLGRAIKGLAAKDELAISTKAGTRIDAGGRLYKDFSPAWLRTSCEESLRKIGIETIPLFHLHGPTIRDLNDGVVAELQQLKARGLVRAIGVNSFDDAVLEHILGMNAFDFVMPDYNILSKEREPLIDRFHERGIGVIAGAALADALYSNRVFKVRSGKDLWYLARALKNFRSKLVRGFSYRFINDHPAISGAQVAISYVLRNPNISSAVFGTTSSKHLDENLAAASKEIPAALLERIAAATP